MVSNFPDTSNLITSLATLFHFFFHALYPHPGLEFHLLPNYPNFTSDTPIPQKVVEFQLLNSVVFSILSKHTYLN